MSKFTVIIYEPLPILNQIYLHRFILAQARELIALGTNVIFCTGDTPNDLKSKFIDVYGIEAGAVNCRDKEACKVLNPTILFTSFINSALKIIFSDKFANNNYTKILWYGGIIPEESYLRNNSNIRRNILIILERIAFKWADIVLVPTQSMLDYLGKNNRLLQNTEFVVVPNAIDALPPLVFEPNMLWGLKECNIPVIGYCGGLSKWQCFDETLEFVKNIQKEQPNFIFLVLTYEPQKALEMISKKGLINTFVKQTTPDNVYRYIQTFDVGILFRHDNAVNEAAFPLKYLDYISNGVPVITTHAVKSITSDALSNYGYIIDLNNIDYISLVRHIKYVAANKSIIKQKLRTNAALNWTFEVINGPIRNIYSTILNVNIKTVL